MLNIERNLVSTAIENNHNNITVNPKNNNNKNSEISIINLAPEENQLYVQVFFILKI